MNYKQKYKKIVNELVRESFPELEKNIPKVFELKFSKLFGIYLPITNRVGINKLCRKFLIDEIRGILVHELCHAEFCRKYGFFKNFFLFFIYWFYPPIRKDEEDRVDKLAIEKGYAKYLVLSSIRLEKLYPKCKNKTFMSHEEIKLYAKEIGKW
ncbi:hypothetical protein KAS08_05205 [Candidatus Pacearchaeota archaeon]|nr:hypothetical protein [Candidatus Pacearchaeota archaeon]